MLPKLNKAGDKAPLMLRWLTKHHMTSVESISWLEKVKSKITLKFLFSFLQVHKSYFSFFFKKITSICFMNRLAQRAFSGLAVSSTRCFRGVPEMLLVRQTGPQWWRACSSLAQLGSLDSSLTIFVLASGCEGFWIREFTSCRNFSL